VILDKIGTRGSDDGRNRVLGYRGKGQSRRIASSIATKVTSDACGVYLMTEQVLQMLEKSKGKS
jgi:hypothetical protein